jgi:pimeloyl-ACP methyl ester carboxylesterase
MAMLDPAPAWFKNAIATPYEKHAIDVLGCPIRYLRWGDPGNPGLVLVHGAGAHARWWAFLAPLLAHHHSIVALDLSGHGDSGHRDLYPQRTWAEEVMAVTRSAHFVGPPILVGHSMGGLVSIVAASLYGDELAGAIIVDALVRKPGTEVPEGGRSFRKLKTYPNLEAARRHFRLIPPQPCDNGYLLDYIAEHSLHEVEGGFTWKFDPAVHLPAKPEALHEHLAGVRCRVALLRGEKSIVVPPETGEYMYQLLRRNAPLVSIPEAHHHLMLDQPLACIAALRALLADWEHSVPHPRERSSNPPRDSR